MMFAVVLMLFLWHGSTCEPVNVTLRSMHRDTRYPEMTAESANHVTNHTKKCTLKAQKNTTDFFTNIILRKRYNLIPFRIHFQNLSVSASKSVIGKYHWVWTYRGPGGGYPYLYLPNDYGYLSFGILLTHSCRKEYDLYFHRVSGNCSGLRIGRPDTDQIIGDAFGEMTSNVASRYDIYNSSYWCYTRRLWLESSFLYWACKNSICTHQTFEYRCCRYHIYSLSKNREVICTSEHFIFGKIWWMLPIIMGEIFFAFYPLLLARIGSEVQKRARSAKRRKGWFLNYNVEQANGGDDSVDDETSRRPVNFSKENYVKLKYGSPISFMSTLFSPFLHINTDGPIIKRLLRSAIIFLPMSLSALRVYLDYKYSLNLIHEAVKKGALVGFSSMLVGYELSRQHFLRIFGGPYVAIMIYIVFGCVTLFIPNDLERTLEKGICLTTSPSTFLLAIPSETTERLSRVYFQNARGYKKIYLYMKAKFCMLFNVKFWWYVLYTFDSRWRSMLYRWLLRKTGSMPFVILLMVMAFPVYVAFSALELLVSVLYFAFPVISSFFLVFKAFALSYFKNFTHQTFRLCQLLRLLVFLPLSVCFTIAWYMYCIIFFDGFWFLSKIVMFTYSGIIAYPKLSYGYLILTLMALYYLVESANKFGQTYQDLLKLAIDASQRVQRRRREDGLDERPRFHRKGVPLSVFSVIVERHQPIRNQMMTTLFKFVSIVTILCISIELLKTFDKFEDLSLVSHVFTVLFICALPKIIRVVFLNKHEHTVRKKMLRKVERTIERVLCNDTTSSGSDDQTDSFTHHLRVGYQSLQHP